MCTHKITLIYSFFFQLVSFRKLSSLHRYSILHSRAQGGPDSLLDDTDDDDPPLDPNPDVTNQRLALDDDDLADDPLGTL